MKPSPVLAGSSLTHSHTKPAKARFRGARKNRSYRDRRYKRHQANTAILHGFSQRSHPPSPSVKRRFVRETQVPVFSQGRSQRFFLLNERRSVSVPRSASPRRVPSRWIMEAVDSRERHYGVRAGCPSNRSV